MNFLRRLNRATNLLLEEGPVHFARRVRRRLGRATGFDEVRLVLRELAPHAKARFMVDVGAHHGGSLIPFLQKGWTVIGFEPDPDNRRRLESRVGRLRDTLSGEPVIFPNAVGENDGERLQFFQSDESTGISGLIPFRDSHVSRFEVETITLKSALSRHGMPAVGFLKIDTEGFDLIALKSFPWSTAIPPEIIVCEFEDAKTERVGYTFPDLGRFLVERGYRVLVSEWFPIQRYGEQHKWNRFKWFPCDLDSSEAWGNFIAVRGDAVTAALEAVVQNSTKVKA